MNITTKVDSAFGFGTRERGFILGTVKDAEEACLIVAEQVSPEFSDLGVELSDGVCESEMITALRNPLRIDFVDPSGVVESEGSKPGDWRSVLIAETPISSSIAGVLSSLEPPILTLGELNDFGEKNDGFESINGIGEKANNKLIEQLIESAGVEAEAD